MSIINLFIRGTIIIDRRRCAYYYKVCEPIITVHFIIILCSLILSFNGHIISPISVIRIEQDF